MTKRLPRFKGHIVLLQKFEKYLTEICPVFLKIDYTLHFILRKKPFSKDFEIEVICLLNKKPSWILFIDEPVSLMGELKLYAMIFGITEVRILIARPNITEIGQTNAKSSSVRERMYYELF
jgi:hypothetical protein